MVFEKWLKHSIKILSEIHIQGCADHIIIPNATRFGTDFWGIFREQSWLTNIVQYQQNFRPRSWTIEHWSDSMVKTVLQQLMCFFRVLKISFSLYPSWTLSVLFKWTASSEFGTYRLCEQRRFRRACASAQSRQNLRCSLIQAVSQEEPSDRKPDPWPLLMAGHAQLKFVMTECSKTQIRLTGLKWQRFTFLFVYYR